MRSETEVHAPMHEEKTELVLEQENGRLAIAAWSDYRLCRISGLESTSYRLAFEERAIGDGDDYRGHRVGRREIQMVIEVLPAHLDAACRQKLIGFFEPGCAGNLEVDRGCGKRWIGYRLGGADFAQESLFSPLRVTVTLICPDPWFYGEEKVLPLGKRYPLLTFPQLSFSGGGLTGGFWKKTRYLYLENEGDLPIGVQADIHILSGTAKDPYIYCAGKRVTVNGTLHAGDLLQICTESGKKAVRINGESASFAIGSDFFQAPKGRSLVIVGCSGGGVSDGTIRYRYRYFGA